MIDSQISDHVSRLPLLKEARRVLEVMFRGCGLLELDESERRKCDTNYWVVREGETHISLCRRFPLAADSSGLVTPPNKPNRSAYVPTGNIPRGYSLHRGCL